MSKFTLRAAASALAGILIAIGGCAEQPTASPAVAEYRPIAAPLAPSFLRGTTTSAVIDANGGKLESSSGHKLVFPAGAVSEPTLITISNDPQFIGVNLEPHGLRFPAGREPVLTLDVAGANIRGLTDLSILYLDETGTVAEVLPTVSLGKAGKVRASLQHFSRYTYGGT